MQEPKQTTMPPTRLNLWQRILLAGSALLVFVAAAVLTPPLTLGRPEPGPAGVALPANLPLRAGLRCSGVPTALGFWGFEYPFYSFWQYGGEATRAWVAGTAWRCDTVAWEYARAHAAPQQTALAARPLPPPLPPVEPGPRSGLPGGATSVVIPDPEAQPPGGEGPTPGDPPGEAAAMPPGAGVSPPPVDADLGVEPGDDPGVDPGVEPEVEPGMVSHHGL